MDIKLIIFVIVVVILMFVGIQYFKQKILKKLITCLRDQDYDTYYKTLESFGCKYFYPIFNRTYMKMNGYVMQGDKYKVIQTFDELLKLKLNRKQELDVCVKAFYFYVDEENKTKTKELLDRITNIKNETITEECTVIYDIFIEKETSYIDAMIEQIPESEGAPRGLLNYMVGVQYHYLHDRKKRDQYLKASLVDLKGSPYELKVKKLLG